ncbi:O-antigen ligase family protein [Myroides odoratimimus]|uniref:O-antigen ligase family protein n=1 Tax=Myroides odoratimimus TaxID=76832 RepID=UPI002577D6AC|nr:O-antigen ligase family protein [Myroides odoratimimus]MDM1521196.1 O-antigen ligase family protein [Myroides odoratimimus]
MDARGIYVLLLIISQIFGLYGGMLQLPRVVAILLLPAFLNSSSFYKDIRETKAFLFFYFFIFFSLLSFLKVIDYLSVIKEICYACVNFLIFAEIIVFAKSSRVDSFRLITFSVTTFVFLTLPIGLVEIMFNLHFSNSIFGSDNIIGGLGISKRYAAITFGNYNLYNHLLAIFFPFVLAFYSTVKNRFIKNVTFVSIILVGYILLINGSRGAILCYLLAIIIFYLFYKKNLKYRTLYNFLFLIVFTAIVLFVLNSDEFVYIISRMSEKGVGDDSRANLIEMGVNMLIDSNLLGVGAGNFTNYVQYNFNSDILVPHNIFVEIFSQYGIIVFGAFIYMLIVLCKNLRNLKNESHFIVLTSLLIFSLAFVINSVYLSNPYLWIYLASLFVVSKNKNVL